MNLYSLPRTMLQCDVSLIRAANQRAGSSTHVSIVGKFSPLLQISSKRVKNFSSSPPKQVHNVSLYRCSKCEIFFKSKKGFEGHMQNRHHPKVVGSDGKPKSRKEMEGLNKVMRIAVCKDLLDFRGIVKGNKSVT